MSKVTLTTVSGTGSIQTFANNVNNNSQAIEEGFDNTLSRDGSSPNEMNANLDMNSYRILNLSDAVSNSEPVTLSQVSDVIESAISSDPERFRGPQGIQGIQGIKGDSGAIALTLTRNQIPDQSIPFNAFIVSGFYSVGDLGTGAVYVKGTSSGPMAIQDAAGTWFELANTYFSATGVNSENIHLVAFPGTNRTIQSFGGVLKVGTDLGGNGGNDVFFQHPPSGQFPFRITEDGQPFFVVSHDAVIPDAYTKTRSSILASLVYGRSNDDTTGTGVTVQSTLEIGAVGVPTSGISEFSNYYAMQSVDLDASITGPLNQWSTDYNLLTNTTSDGAYAPGFIVGLSQRIHNNAPLRAIGGPFNGAFGGSFVVRPIIPGETAEDRTAQRTYPLTAMLQVCGWSGSNRAIDPVNSGAHADADYGALYGLRVGGDGGHVYISNTARSKFEYGAALMDWTHGGLVIDEPHADFFGPAIRVTQNSGVVTFGKTDASDSSLAANGQLHVGYQGGNIKLYGPGTGVSIRSDVNFNGVMLMGSDNTQGGVADFFMYHGPSASIPFYVGASGGVQLYSALLAHADNTITFPSPPPAEASATPGQLCVDGSGFLKIKV